MDFEKLKADTQGQPITGYLADGRYIDIPLISHVKDNLYVGGCIQGVDVGDFFSHVFSLYKWEQYAMSVDTKYQEWTMYDSHNGLDIETVEEAAALVQTALDAGGNVLVHCQAGINRSNLVAATVLMNQGLTAQEAIDLLREQRSPLVLANKTFERHLLAKE